jgi:hypothetical protein
VSAILSGLRFELDQRISFVAEPAFPILHRESVHFIEYGGREISPSMSAVKLSALVTDLSLSATGVALRRAVVEGVWGVIRKFHRLARSKWWLRKRCFLCTELMISRPHSIPEPGAAHGFRSPTAVSSNSRVSSTESASAGVWAASARMRAYTTTLDRRIPVSERQPRDLKEDANE